MIKALTTVNFIIFATLCGFVGGPKVMAQTMIELEVQVLDSEGSPIVGRPVLVYPSNGTMEIPMTGPNGWMRVSLPAQRHVTLRPEHPDFQHRHGMSMSGQFSQRASMYAVRERVYHAPVVEDDGLHEAYNLEGLFWDLEMRIEEGTVSPRSVRQALSAAWFREAIRNATSVVPSDGQEVREEKQEARERLSRQLEDLTRPPVQWRLGVVPRYDTSGAIVINVVPNSPAERSGVRPNEIIFSVDGLPVGHTGYRSVTLPERFERSQSGHVSISVGTSPTTARDVEVQLERR